ncbi:double-strand break repair helicase AddA [Erythrobacter sp. Dej080120_24]|uniref:double-strand break repair helicase AddA n=1 Tax=Erythrobacter sp. Dej080120_24 TaxID=3024837 RepID=UPI00291D3122|nr:double-strand break repair helicase AddA [Erythrobacter sp. Dej080120_24]
MSAKVFPLKDKQLAAANPEDNVWLSASAGTGKTQVLSARVLRLLLTPGVDPSQILCLTFTKAGAAEMATRINEVLARWVRLEETALFKDLGNLGADQSAATMAHARTLFASVIDCPGGGLRIDTIHAFSQWLLSRFPEEAGLLPGARPMEDRDREMLARDVLAEMLEEAEANGDEALLGAVRKYSLEKGPNALLGWLMRCAGAADLWEGHDAWQPPMQARVNRLIGIPSDADERWAEELLHPDNFPDGHLRSMLPLMQEWNAKAGREASDFIARWLVADVSQRAEIVSSIYDSILKKDGEPRVMAKPTQAEPRLPDWQQAVAEAMANFEARKRLLALSDFITPALELGRAFFLRWEEAKAREGLLDFDDLIRKAGTVLKNSTAADWIRYKLDRSFDHVLIDEAQDTNSAQWDIVHAVIDDYFSGEGARGDKIRTIFTVGDYKQAIFGFQGTSPDNFERAKQKVHARILAARANAEAIRSNRRMPTWKDLELGLSYRTSPVVLDFVNRVIEMLGFPAFGLKKAPEPHESSTPELGGLVTLWDPVTVADNEEEDDEGRGPDAGENSDYQQGEERGWLPKHDTVLAEKIAKQVHQWIYGPEPFVLEKGKRRYAQAGDVMVLVRRRAELAREIVAKLYAKGVPVAGVDRLRLGDPLAVKDLMAALRFAAQPLDDLSLANLLSSPLIGWSQDDLLQFIPRKPKSRLWEHLRDHSDAKVIETVEKLRELLARADFETPQALLAWLLTGPWQGRKRLVERLGREANDPIDELVNTAFAYQSGHIPSLAGFIAWFDAGDGELKRDSDEATGQVRVMTVHGSKGLQAPIVILADATGKPGESADLELVDDPSGTLGEEARKVPVPPVSKDARAGRLAEAHEAALAANLQEHWRLLYVAMTRAEEALFIGGALTAKQAKSGVPEDSWYAHLEAAFDGERIEDPIWYGRRQIGEFPRSGDIEDKPDRQETADLPPWLTQPIGPEPRPPRPLAPSSAGEVQGSDPPLPAEAAALAARRGTLIHRMLERLPEIASSQRMKQATAWLERQAGDLDEAVRAEMLESALAVVEQPEFAEIFSPSALAEVPLAATVGGVVIAGTADRLLITEKEVTVVDFKTTRRPPERIEEIPVSTLRQMSAYAAALAKIYPGRTIRAAILYTHAPSLFEIPAVTLDLHKDRLGEAQESYAPAAIE